MNAALAPDFAIGGNATQTVRMRRVFDLQRRAFELPPYPTLQERKTKLRALIHALRRHQDDIVAAVHADFGVRSGSETKLIEVMGPVLEARHALSHLGRWMKARRRSTELLFKTNSAWVMYQPKGVVGVIGTWNFPLFLPLGPLVAALAECFGEDEVAVFGGEVAAAQAFNALPFDHLVFTGSPRVAREVMRIAAEHLTPVTLELGGKSPAIIGPDADLRDAALRVAHGKALNAGQVCVAPDYVLVPRGRSADFARAVREAFLRLYPTVSGNADYTSIFSERHAVCLHSLLADARAHGAEILSCGSESGADRQMPLQVVTNVNEHMQLMREEIVGPILPVLEYDQLDDATAFVRRGERPLSLYAFGLDREEQDRLLQQTDKCRRIRSNPWARRQGRPAGGPAA